jgi:hypothetical protein
LLLLPLSGACAQPSPTVEAIEAAYIHKFAGYIEWPAAVFAGPGAPFVVGVAGSEKVHDELLRIVAGRPVQGRPMQVRPLSLPQQAAEVHIVFIGRDVWKNAPAWFAATKGRPVAVITDAPRGVELGALLTFVEVREHLRFEASVAAAEEAGLKLSSRLLAVAERVVEGRP